jgi:hypothetical protein
MPFPRATCDAEPIEILVLSICVDAPLAQFFSHFFCQLLPKQLTNLSAASKSLGCFEFGKSFLVPERRQICRLLLKQLTNLSAAFKAADKKND